MTSLKAELNAFLGGRITLPAGWRCGGTVIATSYLTLRQKRLRFDLNYSEDSYTGP